MHNSSDVITDANFPGLKLLKKGKVRDIYDVGEHLLVVATDRLSAYDVVMPQGIQWKGKVLTQISLFWFGFSADVIRNHVVSANVEDFPLSCAPYASVLRGRSMLVKKAKPLGVECIVRGYLSGSGWAEYKKSNSVCGIRLPEGLVESSKLQEPIFTPSTKEEVGVHDQNISFEKMAEMEGKEVSLQVRDTVITIFKKASTYAESKGMIIADTKMEFGMCDGELILIDELLTPDSSRFWPMDRYRPGRSQESFDKQFVRDYLTSINFNKRPPGPMMPEEILRKTSDLYRKALLQLTGKEVE
jgi:phosphoribosylaminoimidazole-succinocarboxamide synthase